MSLKSKICAEDPKSAGEEPLGEEMSNELRRFVIAEHYAGILRKLNQQSLAASLETGTILPDQLHPQATVWELQFLPPRMKQTRFVGGVWPSADGVLPFAIENGKLVVRPPNPLRLDAGQATFFGVEESVFRQIASIARRGFYQADEVSPLEDVPPFYSAISVLRDGSILGPAEFFMPVETISV